MKKLLFTAILFALVSCGGETISEIKEGMSEAQVKQLLGEPNMHSSSSNSYTVNSEEISSGKVT